MLRPSLLKLLLVIALLFAQEGMLMHGISHVLAEQQQDHSLPHDEQCELCAAYAQVGSALGGTPIHFEFAEVFTEAPRTPAAAVRTVACRHFTARAPPRYA